MDLDSFDIDLSIFDDAVDRLRYSIQDPIDASKTFDKYFMISVLNSKYDSDFSVYEFCKPMFSDYDISPLMLKKRNVHFLSKTITGAVIKFAKENNINLHTPRSTVPKTQENIAFFALRTLIVLIKHHYKAAYNLENVSILGLICGDLCRNYKPIIEQLNLPFDSEMLYSFNTFFD